MPFGLFPAPGENHTQALGYDFGDKKLEELTTAQRNLLERPHLSLLRAILFGAHTKRNIEFIEKVRDVTEALLDTLNPNEAQYSGYETVFEVAEIFVEHIPEYDPKGACAGLFPVSEED